MTNNLYDRLQRQGVHTGIGHAGLGRSGIDSEPRSFRPDPLCREAAYEIAKLRAALAAAERNLKDEPRNSVGWALRQALLDALGS